MFSTIHFGFVLRHSNDFLSVCYFFPVAGHCFRSHGFFFCFPLFLRLLLSFGMFCSLCLSHFLTCITIIVYAVPLFIWCFVSHYSIWWKFQEKHSFKYIINIDLDPFNKIEAAFAAVMILYWLCCCRKQINRRSWTFFIKRHIKSWAIFLVKSWLYTYIFQYFSSSEWKKKFKQIFAIIRMSAIQESIW